MDATELKHRIGKIDTTGYDEQDMAEISSWINKIEELEALDADSQSFITKERVSRYQKEIGNMEKRLLSDRDLDRLGRLNLMDRVALYKEFISSFDAESQLKALEAHINQSL